MEITDNMILAASAITLKHYCIETKCINCLFAKEDDDKCPLRHPDDWQINDQDLYDKVMPKEN